MLSPADMHAFLLSLLMSVSPGHASQTELRTAMHEVEVTKAKWDAAVVGEHPVPAGKWAVRHFAAMQKVKRLQNAVK